MPARRSPSITSPKSSTASSATVYEPHPLGVHQGLSPPVLHPLVPVTKPDTTDGKNKGGRPPKFKDVKTLQKAIERYFAERDLEEDTRVFKHDRTIDWVDPDVKKAKPLTICTRCRHKTT